MVKSAEHAGWVVIVIVGSGFTVTVTACVVEHPLAFVTVIVPEYGPPAVVFEGITIPPIDPPPGKELKAVFPWF